MNKFDIDVEYDYDRDKYYYETFYEKGYLPTIDEKLKDFKLTRENILNYIDNFDKKWITMSEEVVEIKEISPVRYTTREQERYNYYTITSFDFNGLDFNLEHNSTTREDFDIDDYTYIENIAIFNDDEDYYG